MDNFHIYTAFCSPEPRLEIIVHGHPSAMRETEVSSLWKEFVSASLLIKVSLWFSEQGALPGQDGMYSGIDFTRNDRLVVFHLYLLLLFCTSSL